MENGGANKRKITGDELLTKLKDDGDFDKLRVKIIRRLKDDGELRNNIISVVKQSSALNRPGAENMKPRQLSDAIQQEIGSGVMSQISDSVWEIIRSGDGMKTEITETVQSVYNKLVNPELNECGESSSRADLLGLHKEHEKNGSLPASSSEVHNKIHDGEPIEPPGFTAQGDIQNNTHIQHYIPNKGQKDFSSDDGKTTGTMQKTYQCKERSEPHSTNDPQLGTSEAVAMKQSDDGSDDDPDLPPGFGWIS